MIIDKFLSAGEYGGAGMYEEPGRSLFYRKSLGIRRYFENCPLPEYRGELLYPSGVAVTDASIYPFYLTGMNVDLDSLSKKSPDAAQRFVSDFCRYKSSVPIEHTVGGNMYTHSMPNYERILSEGLLSYEDRIKYIADIDMHEGLLHLICGIRAYIKRCTDYLADVKADEKLISALKKVPLNPAENIYEALVSWNFVMYLDNCDNLGCLASGLYPYYKGEDISALLENLYDNLDKNGGYSMALGVDYNSLTLLCLEASKGRRRPMIELFVDDDTPDYIWKKAFEVIRTQNGQPAFYNHRLIMDGLKKRFPTIKDDDLKKFCGGGCTETMLAGLSAVGSLDAGINLLFILDELLHRNLGEAESFEEFYCMYISRVREVADRVTDEITNSRLERAKYNPLPMRTLLVDDCIDNEADFNNGGARYNWSIFVFYA